MTEDRLKKQNRFALVVTLVAMFAVSAQAAVTVTPASGGTNISADKAANATTPAYTALVNIIIVEGANTDFAHSGGSVVTLVLEPPTGWSFEASQGSTTRNGGPSDFQNPPSIGVTATAATVQFRINNTTAADTLTVSGLRVRPNDGVLGNTPAGDIVRGAASTSTINGVSGATNFGSLSMTFGAAKQLSVDTQPSSAATAGVAFAPQPAIRVEDQHGNLRTTDNTTSVSAARDGGGSPAIQGTLSATASAGIATFLNLSHNKAETISLAFSSSGLTGTTSNNVVVSAANASTVKFTTHPGGATAGAAFSTQPVLQTFDAFDNLSNGGLAASVPITLAVASGPGTFHGSSTTLHDIGTGGGNGTITGLDLRIDTAGAHTLSASGFGTATSDAFTVAAGPADHLAMVQDLPANATAGVAFSPAPAVRIFDAFGNPTSATNTITATRNSGSGTAALQGDTSEDAVGGLATFNDLRYNVAGETIAVDFASIGLTGVTSGSVTVAAGPAASFDVSTPASAQAGDVISVSVTARDSGGNVATGYTGTVQFTSNDAQAVLPGDYTFLAGDNGVKSFNVTLKTSGNRTVTATDGGINGTSNNVNVSPGAPLTLSLTAPVNATAGNAFNVTVAARDAFNNVAPSYTGTVHFTSGDPQATMPANYTFLVADNGAKILSFTLGTSGVQSITGTDTVTATITGNKNVTVVAGAATSMTITGPANTTAGDAFDVTVTLRDAFSNIATGYTGTVAFSSTDVMATLPANYPFTGGDAGQRVFSVTLKNAGTHTITANDGTLTDATDNIDVAPAAAASLTTSAPANAIAGDAFDFTVTARDAFGNIATGYAETVGFTSTDGIAILPADYAFTGADSGVRTFSATLKTSGTRTITANDGTFSDASNSISVAPGTATNFVVALPATSTAGTAFSATITAKDAFTNTATGYTGTIGFSSDDPQGVLPGNYTFVSGDNGVRTFTNALTLKTAGSRSVTATDTVSASINGNNTMTVNATTVAGLGFTTQPGGAVAGSTFTAVVKTQDAFGNNSIVGLANNANIALDIASGTGTLQGGGNINAGNNGATPGTATFSNLRIDTAGIKTLAASNNQLTGATSAAFTVDPGPATSLFFTTDPGGAAAGSAFGTQPAIETRDAFGNDSSSGLGGSRIVTIALQSGTGTLQGTTTVDIGTANGNGAGTYSGLRIDTTGAKTLSISAPGLTGATSNSFTVAPGPAAVIVKLAGDNQTAPAGSTLPTDPSVRIEDAFTNAIPSQPVTFAPAAGSGSVTGGSQTTNGSGVATVTSWTLGPTAGANTLNVTAGAASTSFSAIGICTYTTLASGTWNDGSTWVGGCVPTIADDAVIAEGHTVTVTADASAGTLTFDAATISSAVVLNNGVTLSVEGLLRIEAPLNANIEAVMNVGHGTLDIGGLEMNGAGNRKAILTVAGGTVNLDGNATFPGNPPTQILEITGAGSMNITGNFAAGSTLELSPTSTITFNGSQLQTIGSYNPNNFFSNLVIDSDVTMLGNLPVSDSLVINSGRSLNAGSGSLHLHGDMTVNGGFSTTGNLNVNGTSPQTIDGTTSPIALHNVTMNNAAGLTLATQVTAGGTLTLTLGNIDTGANTLTILGSGSVSRTSGHVIGNLARVFTAAGTKAFDVGTANGYSPVSVNATTGTFPATVTTTAVQGAHPNSPTANALQRYWTLNAGGVTAADLTFTYLPADVVGNELAYRLARHSGGWAYPTASVDTILHTASGAGITSFGDFTLHAQAVGIAITSVNGGVNPVAGTPFDVVVQAVDALGNATGVPANTPIALTLDTGTGPLGGTLNGAIAFGNTGTTISGVTYTKAESGVILTATATGGVSAADDSDPFTVDPGATTHFTVAAPPTATAGVAFNATITALDAYDNVTPAFSGTVIVTSTDGDATLPADGTLTGGTRLDSITLRTSGNQTITATSGVITGSAEVAVAAAATDHFTINAPATTIAGDPFAATVTALDAFDNVTTTYSGTVSFTSSDPVATLPPGYAFNAGSDQGDHAFTGLALITAGTQTITVTDGPITGQATIDVQHAALDHFRVEAPAGGNIAPQQAGVAFAVRITARDAFGNTHTAFSGTLDLSSNAGTVSPLTVTFAGADNGVKTINVTLTAANAAATVTATHAPSGNSGSSNSFVVSAAGAANHLVEAGGGGNIGPQTAGIPFPVRITARDTFGNTATGFTGTLTVTTDVGDIAPTNVTFIASDNGVKTINVTLTASGAGRTITAADTNGAGTSNPFTVNAGPLHHFAIESAGGGTIPPQTAGAPFAIRISALDVHNNVVVSFNGTGNTVDISSSGTLSAGAGTTATFANGLLASHGLNFGTGGSSFTITATRTGGSESGTATIIIGGLPNLAVSVNGPASAMAGEGDDYSVVIRNNGSSPAANTSVSLTPPAGWILQPSAPCASFPCNIGTVGAGAQQTINFRLITPLGTAGGLYTITASASSSSGESDPSDNSDTFSTRVAACPTVSNMRPVTRGAASGELTWSAPGASRFDVYLGVQGSGCTTLVGNITAPRFAYSNLQPNTTYEWRVVAHRSGCGVITSACARFTTEEEDVCAAPRISAVSETSTRSSFHVRWSDVHTTRYQLQQSSSTDFTSATQFEVNGSSRLFRFDVASPTAYYFRVKGVDGCSDEWSRTLRVVVQPMSSGTENDFDIPIERGSTDQLTQPAGLTPEEGVGISANASFIAVSNAAWLKVTPASGTIPPSGLVLALTADPATLRSGSTTGTVSVRAPDNSLITTYSVTVHAMEPVEESGKSASQPAAVIPAVGHAAGIGSHWRSDVRIYNPSATAAAYDLLFTPSRTDGTLEGRRSTMTIEAGATLALGDVVRRIFGYGAMGESATGALEIRPVDGSSNAVISSRTYNQTDSGTYGQFIPAIPASAFAGTGTTLSLQQLAQSAAYRTNVGLVEGSGNAANVIVRFYNATGQKLAEETIALAPFEHQQIDSMLARHDVKIDDARLEVEVSSSKGTVAAYASLVDNVTSDPLLVTGVVPAAVNAQRYVVPGVAHYATGRNNWRSDVRIYNAGEASISATLTFHPEGGAGAVTRMVTLFGREVKAYDNIIEQMFGKTQSGGALHVSTSTASKLVVTARTYDRRDTGGTYGQFIPAMTIADASRLGGRAIDVLQLEQSARFRSNVGVAEVAGHSAQVEVIATGGDGQTSSMTIDLAPYEFRQYGSLLANLGLDGATNARVSIRVIGGNGAVIGYGSAIDNRTQDPTYVPAQ